MLKPANPDSIYCYERAGEARRAAHESLDARMRDELLASEARWLKLAASYEFSERLDRFVAEPSVVPEHPACTRCDVPMSLTKMQTGSAGGRYLFECKACGATKTMTQDSEPLTS